MSDPALELIGVTAGYGATHVLNDVSLSLDKGERLALIGRNGVGKTTTLATAMGLTTLHGGSVRLNGEDVTKLKPFQRARKGLGLVPQTRDIFPSLSVEENLIAGAQGAEADLARAYALFPRLAERKTNGGGQLSGGEQQMLAIARTLMSNPEVILLDESLEGLAPVICEMLMEVFERLAADGQTLVLVEQHAELAIDFADRVIILDTGRVVWAGTSEEISAQPELLERHVGMALHE